MKTKKQYRAIASQEKEDSAQKAKKVMPKSVSYSPKS